MSMFNPKFGMTMNDDKPEDYGWSLKNFNLLNELNKLEKYLKDNKIPYQRIDERGQSEFNLLSKYLERHQIIYPNKEMHLWDVICHPGSYGYDEGLLELMGNISRTDDVEGYLTAEDVIERIKEYDKN